MKKFILILSILTFPLLSEAQCKSLKEVQNEFKGLDDVFSLNMSAGFLNIGDWFTGDDSEDDVIAAFDGIENVKILKVPSGKYGMQKEHVMRFKKDLGREHFDELMEIRTDEGHKFYAMAKEKNGIVSDLVIFGAGENNIIFLELMGNMNAKKVAKACRKIQMGEV